MTIAYITIERFTALEERLDAIESQPGTPALAGEIDRMMDRLDEAERNVAWLRAANITPLNLAERMAALEARIEKLEQIAAPVSAAEVEGPPAHRKCPACGHPVLHRYSARLKSWLPVEYHDCKLPMPAAQGDDAAERDGYHRKACDIADYRDRLTAELAEAKALLTEAVDIAKGIRGCAERGAPNITWQDWWARLQKVESIVAAGGSVK